MDSTATVSETITSQITTPKVASPIPATQVIKPPTQQRTIRIHVNTIDQPRPVIFNYRQLYKRELKKDESNTTHIEPVAVSSLETADDLFYKELLKKAESYAMDEDDVDDDGSDDETNAVGSKKQVGNEYDFEDPFIDDSEMMLDEPQEYSAPEFDGFFVYHGPLDGHETAEKSKTTTTTTPKRKAPSKAKTGTSTTTATAAASKRAASNTSDKSRKKASDESEKSTPAGTPTTTTSSAASKPKKVSTTAPSTTTTTTTNTTGTNTSTPTSTTTTPKPINNTEKQKTSVPTNTTTNTTTVNRKTTSSNDQPAKKRKKLDTKETDKDHTKSATHSPSLSVNEDTDKKKKNGPFELKPLDPEIEALMDKLRRDVVHEDFENKAKFPMALKPTVLEAGLVMLRKSKEIDENLVYHLMSILPYNRFTLKKFLTTKSGQMRVDELQQEIDELAILLKHTIDKMMPEQQRLFEEKAAQPTSSEEEAPQPQPKFKCNDEVRKILYDIIQSEEQSIHIANQVALHKDTEKKNEGLASDGKARKLMYQRLLSCWPEGWMNSYEMSRQYSQYKLKLATLSEKKAANNIPVSTATTDAKKRKRVITPQSSPSDEGLRKKQSIIDSGMVPPDASLFTQKINATQHPVITIEDDDDDTVQQNNWKQANSMKIEALISRKN